MVDIDCVEINFIFLSIHARIALYKLVIWRVKLNTKRKNHAAKLH